MDISSFTDADIERVLDMCAAVAGNPTDAFQAIISHSQLRQPDNFGESPLKGAIVQGMQDAQFGEDLKRAMLWASRRD